MCPSVSDDNMDSVGCWESDASGTMVTGWEGGGCVVGDLKGATVSSKVLPVAPLASSAITIIVYFNNEID